MLERKLWVLIATLAILTGSARPAAAQAEQNSAQHRQPTPKLTAAALPSPQEDTAAERALLELANESRQAAGVSPLHPDAGLSKAARDHVRLMVAHGTLSHQYAGEPALLERITQAGSIRLDRAGENVALNTSAASTHDALMHSPPHRENLLDPRFNATGIAAIWSDGQLFVVEDFATELPAYSSRQSEQVVVHAINEVRRRAGLSPLARVSVSELDSAVCSLTRQNRLRARPLNVAYPSREVITYTQSQPDILPGSAVQALGDGSIRQFAVGACYRRDSEYPSGTYWVAILLY